MDSDALFKICEASPRGVLIASADGLIVHVNSRMAEALKINVKLEINKSLRNSRIFGDKRRSELMKLVNDGVPFEFTNTLIRGSEERQWKFSGHEFPGGFIIEGEDVTRELANSEIARLFEEKYGPQIRIAQDLQRDLFPTSFQKKRIDVHTYLKAADDLAGDFFSITELSPNAIGVVIGDVVDKGIPASLMAILIHTFFMQEAKLMRSPSELMTLINTMLHSRFKSDLWYATAFYARILVTNLTVTYSRAGHELPLVYRAATGEVETLKGEGLPLGMFASSYYQTHQIQLEKDDHLFLFTDGLTDTVSPDVERYGHERLHEFLKRNGNKSGGELLDILIREIEDFSAGAKCADDIAIAIFSVVPNMWTTWEIPPRGFIEMLDSIIFELSETGIDEDTIFDIRLAVDECVINAQKHGNKRETNKPVHVSYLIDSKKCIFKIRDTGKGYEYENLPDPTLEENVLDDHGRGVHITRKVMDEVSFNETGNEITIVRNFQKNV